MDVTVFGGTRPEFVKLAPVVRGLRHGGARVELVVTGQHRGAMADDHLAEQGLEAWCTWSLPSGEAERCGALLSNAMAHFAAHPTDLAIVQGDTYTAPLVAMGARRHGVPVAHVEAGLRSHNARSQEELNRRMVADLATIHFAPTRLAGDHLVGEGVSPEVVHVVGNTICDALASTGIARVRHTRRRGVLFTAHRATNVDDPHRLRTIVTIAARLATRHAVWFPVHPRTADRLAASGLDGALEASGVTVVEPMGHRALLQQLASSLIAVTDSGGIQEEAAWFGVPDGGAASDHSSVGGRRVRACRALRSRS